MPTVTEANDRSALQTQPDHDAQPWKGYGSDRKKLHFGSRMSERGRRRCTIENHTTFERRSQVSGSIQSHFADNPDPNFIIFSPMGQPLAVTFDRPIIAAGLDVEAVPVSVEPNQEYRVVMRLFSNGALLKELSKKGKVQTATFIGATCDSEAIARMEISVLLINRATGAEAPVRFCANGLDFRASP